MATLDTKDRDKLRSSQFAYVDKDGGEHLPINDESHVRNAIARFNQTDFQSKSRERGSSQEDPRGSQALRHRCRRRRERRQAGPLRLATSRGAAHGRPRAKLPKRCCGRAPLGRGTACLCAEPGRAARPRCGTDTQRRTTMADTLRLDPVTPARRPP